MYRRIDRHPSVRAIWARKLEEEGELAPGEADALLEAQMERLRSEFGVYGVDSGRICVAALNSRNIDYVVSSIAKVL